MKKALCGVVLLALSGTAHAADPVHAAAGASSLALSGDFLLALQWTSWSESYWDAERGIGETGYGRVLVPLSGAMAAQLDVAYTSTAFSYNLNSEALLGVHLNARDPERRMFGIMAAVGNGVVDDYEGYPSLFVGAEAQIYRNMNTMFLQGGYAWAHEGPDPDDEPLAMGVVRGGIRHFVNPDFRIDGELGYAMGTFNDSPVGIASWGLGVERLLTAGGPMAMVLRYQGAWYSHSDCAATMVEHSVLAGISIKLGTTTLLQQDRYGANSDFPRFPSYAAVDNLEYC